MWNYTITNTGNSGQVISVKVTSQSSDPDAYPVTVDVFWSESNLDVSQPGHAPQALFATVYKGNSFVDHSRDLCPSYKQYSHHNFIRVRSYNVLDIIK